MVATAWRPISTEDAKVLNFEVVKKNITFALEEHKKTEIMRKVLALLVSLFIGVQAFAGGIPALKIVGACGDEFILQR